MADEFCSLQSRKLRQWLQAIGSRLHSRSIKQKTFINNLISDVECERSVGKRNLLWSGPTDYEPRY